MLVVIADGRLVESCGAHYFRLVVVGHDAELQAVVHVELAIFDGLLDLLCLVKRSTIAASFFGFVNDHQALWEIILLNSSFSQLVLGLFFAPVEVSSLSNDFMFHEIFVSSLEIGLVPFSFVSILEFYFLLQLFQYVSCLNRLALEVPSGSVL